MAFRLTPWMLLGLALPACVEVAGLSEGGSCNEADVCVRPFLCVEGTCRSHHGLGTWEQELGAADAGFRAVWGSAPDDVYVVGATGAVHFGGGSWNPVENLPAAKLSAVWGRDSGHVWLGGESVLLAKSPAGFAPQTLSASGEPIIQFSVLSLAGSASAEYALIEAGGKSLLMRNDGEAWRKLAALSFTATDLAVVGSGFNFLTTAGIQRCIPDPYGVLTCFEKRGDTPGLRAIRASTAGDRFVAVGGGTIVLETVDGSTRFSEDRLDARGVWVGSPDDYFVVGAGTTSGILACGVARCTPEAVAAPWQANPLVDAWSDGEAVWLAIGDEIILRRTLPSP